MRRSVLMALVFLVAVPVGVGAGATPTHRTGLLHGVVTRGAACKPGQSQPCIPPVPGVKIVFVRNRQAIAQTTTASDGTYRIRLRAGRYRVQLPGRSEWRPRQVLVRRGENLRVNIAFDAPTG